MSKATIKAEIDANVTQNGNQEITGEVLNSILNDIVDDYADHEEISMLEVENILQEINLSKILHGGNVGEVVYVADKTTTGTDAYVVTDVAVKSGDKFDLYVIFENPVQTRIGVYALGNVGSLVVDNDTFVHGSFTAANDTPQIRIAFLDSLADENYKIVIKTFKNVDGIVSDIENIQKELIGGEGWGKKSEDTKVTDGTDGYVNTSSILPVGEKFKIKIVFSQPIATRIGIYSPGNVGVIGSQGTPYTEVESGELTCGTNSYPVRIALLDRPTAGTSYQIIVYTYEIMSGLIEKVQVIEGVVSDKERVFDIPKIEGYYLEPTDPATATSYNGYFISYPIALKKGDIVRYTGISSGTSVIAGTNLPTNAPREDVIGASFTRLVQSDSSASKTYEYVAENDCNIVVCGKISQSDKVTIVSAGVDSEDVFYNGQRLSDVLDGSHEDGNIPAYFGEQAKNTYKRFAVWKGADDCMVFPIITDLHADDRDASRKDLFKCIPWILSTDDVFGYNFVAHLGDFGLGNNNSITEDLVFKRLHDVSKAFNPYRGMILYAQGNHDAGEGQSVYFPKRYLVDTYMQSPSYNRGYNIIHDNANQVKYFDWESLKVRAVVVNTTNNTDRGGYIMTQSQLEWIVETLSNTPNDFNVLIMGHFCPQKIGEWSRYVSSSDYAEGADDSIIAFVKIMEGFANKTSGSYDGVSFDFTNTTSKLIGYVCGDSHFSAYLKADETKSVKKTIGGVIEDFNISGNGVNYYISQGYGPISPADVPTWATHDVFDYRNETLIDVVAIKPFQGKMKIFRIGVGGDDRDIEFDF